LDILQLNKLFVDLLARNRGPGYGVAVTSFAPDISSVDITVTFVTGRTYCCCEPFCHVPVDARKVLRFASERGIALPELLQVRWHFVLEAGALLACNKSLGIPGAANHQEYDAISTLQTVG
jgi:hypothetical protein